VLRSTRWEQSGYARCLSQTLRIHDIPPFMFAPWKTRPGAIGKLTAFNEAQ